MHLYNNSISISRTHDYYLLSSKSLVLRDLHTELAKVRKDRAGQEARVATGCIGSVVGHLLHSKAGSGQRAQGGQGGQGFSRARSVMAGQAGHTGGITSLFLRISPPHLQESRWLGCPWGGRTRWRQQHSGAGCRIRHLELEHSFHLRWDCHKCWVKSGGHTRLRVGHRPCAGQRVVWERLESLGVYRSVSGTTATGQTFNHFASKERTS